MNVPIVQLNGGEFSPLIEARADTEKHRSGCRKLENMLPTVQGPVERRQGTKYIYTSTVIFSGEANMSFCDYLENKLLNHLFNKASFTIPTVYIALSTTAPGDSGSDKTEPSGFAYARYTTSAANWNTSTTSETTNAAEFAFPESTGNWGTISYYVLMDALTGGNCLAVGTLDTPTLIEEGDIFTFAIGSITITLD